MVQIADYFPEDSIVCYYGDSGEEGQYTRVGRRQLVKALSAVETIQPIVDYDFDRLWILYHCYLEIVWGKEWSEEDKTKAINTFVSDYEQLEDGYEAEELYSQLLEDGKLVSSKELAVRLCGQISSVTTFSLVRGRIATKTVFPDKWGCLFYILMQYITHPELQNGDGTRRIAYCARCGAEFLQEHKARRYCDICGSGAIRQRAFRERRKEAIQRKGRGKR